MAHIGKKGESLVACFYAITHIVSTVMRHFEAGYGEITQADSFFFFYQTDAVCRKFFGHAVAALHTFVDSLCGIDGDIIPFGKVAYNFYMVGMVMCDKDGVDTLHVNVVILEYFLYSADAYSGIY